MKKNYLAYCVYLMLGVSTSTYADVVGVDNTFSLGIASGFSSEIYKGYGTTYLPYLNINYEKDNFFIKGFALGYHLYNENKHTFSAIGYYYALSFKPDDSDDWRLKQLDKRRTAIMAGVAYNYRPDWGNVSSSVAYDITGNSDSIILDAAYSYPMELSLQWAITPEIGVIWNNKNHNRYYYGISHHESLRSGLTAYAPQSSWSPYAELSNNFKITNNLNFNIVIRETKLNSEIKDSPMVSKNYETSALASINYSF